MVEGGFVGGSVMMVVKRVEVTIEEGEKEEGIERGRLRGLTPTVLTGNPSGTFSLIGILNDLAQRRRSTLIHLSLSDSATVSSHISIDHFQQHPARSDSENGSK